MMTKLGPVSGQSWTSLIRISVDNYRLWTALRFRYATLRVSGTVPLMLSVAAGAAESKHAAMDVIIRIGIRSAVTCPRLAVTALDSLWTLDIRRWEASEFLGHPFCKGGKERHIGRGIHITGVLAPETQERRRSIAAANRQYGSCP